jgi:hypothetical protein
VELGGRVAPPVRGGREDAAIAPITLLSLIVGRVWNTEEQIAERGDLSWKGDPA